MRSQSPSVTETALSLFDRSLASIERAAVAGATAEVEDVHQLRVGTKRIRAVIALTLTIDPAFDGGAGEKMLRRLFRAAAGLRDLDVQLALAQRIAGDSGVDVGATTAALTARRAGAVRSFVREAARYDISRARALRDSIRTSLTALDERSAATLADATLQSWFQELQHSPGEDLHEVRKRTKRAHALSWILARATSSPATRRLETRLDGLQKLLGDWHDLFVAQEVAVDDAYREEAARQSALVEKKIRRRVAAMRPKGRGKRGASGD